MNKNIQYCLLFLISLNVYAQRDFTFGEFKLSGSGCPQGTYDIVKTPDNETVSILFSDFSAEVPQQFDSNDNHLFENNGRHVESENLSYKVCNIRVNALLPENYKLDGIFIDVQFRGAAMIDPGAEGRVQSKLMSWQGPRGRRGRRIRLIDELLWVNNSRKTIDKNWLMNKRVFISTEDSKCSVNRERAINALIKNSVVTRINKEYLDPFASLFFDSADFSNKIEVNFKLSKCQRGSSNSHYGHHGSRTSNSSRNRHRGARVSRSHRGGYSGSSNPRCTHYRRYSNGRRVCLN